MRRRPRPCRLVADPGLAAVVTEPLEATDSPMTIARELAAGTHGMTASISHESIYQVSPTARARLVWSALLLKFGWLLVDVLGDRMKCRSAGSYVVA